jgi:hypothetical protein
MSGTSMLAGVVPATSRRAVAILTKQAAPELPLTVFSPCSSSLSLYFFFSPGIYSSLPLQFLPLSLPPSVYFLSARPVLPHVAQHAALVKADPLLLL